MRALIRLCVALVALAAIAALWPPLICSPRWHYDEAAAAATIKHTIYPALIRMQVSGDIDDDANGVGEYGFINQLNGAAPLLAADGTLRRATGNVHLLSGQLGHEVRADEIAISNGYYIKVYLPDGRGGMYDYQSYAKDPDKKVGAQLREKYFLVVAWPVDFEKEGRRIYVMVQDGRLHTSEIGLRLRVGKGGPSWRRVFGGNTGSFEEKLQQGPSDTWLSLEK